MSVGFFALPPIYLYGRQIFTVAWNGIWFFRNHLSWLSHHIHFRCFLRLNISKVGLSLLLVENQIRYLFAERKVSLHNVKQHIVWIDILEKFYCQLVSEWERDFHFIYLLITSSSRPVCLLNTLFVMKFLTFPLIISL